jgi:hypothetical protein
MSEQVIDSQPLMEASQAQRVFMALFQELYSIPEPVLPLGSILHWADVVRRLGVPDTTLNHTTTQVFGGYFYNTSTRVPSPAEIEEALDLGRASGVSQFLVPTVRNTAAPERLLAHGFRCIPWFIESIFELQDGVDSDLEARLGRSRHKSIVRVSRKVEKQYPARFYELADIESVPAILETAAALHECNVRKYGHALNFYSASILKRLCTSALAEHILICIRRDKDTGEAVQASISLIDRRRRQLYWLVQGIFREKVTQGYNLFIADAYQLFIFAERNGVREINLSRGGQEQKRKLGANRFILLNNWILNPSPDAAVEISTITARCKEILGLEGPQEPMIGSYRLQ